MSLKKMFSGIIGCLLLISAALNGQTLTEKFEGTKAEMLSLTQTTSSSSRNAECTDPFGTISQKFDKELANVKSISENIANYKTKNILEELFQSIDAINNTYDVVVSEENLDSAGVEYARDLTTETLTSLSTNFRQIAGMNTSIKIFYKNKKNEIVQSSATLARLKSQLVAITDCIQEELTAILQSPDIDELTTITVTRLEKEAELIQDLTTYVETLQAANETLQNSIIQLEDNLRVFMHTMAETSIVFKTASIVYKAKKEAEEYFEDINANLSDIQTLSDGLADISTSILALAEGL